MSVSLCKVMCERVDIYLEKENEKKNSVIIGKWIITGKW